MSSSYRAHPSLLHTLSLHDALPILERFLDEIGFVAWNLEQDRGRAFAVAVSELSERFPHYADFIRAYDERWEESIGGAIDRKSTRLNSSHRCISYAVFCLKKKTSTV